MPPKNHCLLHVHAQQLCVLAAKAKCQAALRDSRPRYQPLAGHLPAMGPARHNSTCSIKAWLNRLVSVLGKAHRLPSPVDSVLSPSTMHGTNVLLPSPTLVAYNRNGDRIALEGACTRSSWKGGETDAIPAARERPRRYSIDTGWGGSGCPRHTHVPRATDWEHLQLRQYQAAGIWSVAALAHSTPAALPLHLTIPLTRACNSGLK